MKLIALMLIGIVALTGSGCATANGVKAAEQARLAYEAFVRQERTFQAVELSGKNMQITIAGADRLAIRAPMDPLKAMPENADTAGRVIDGLKNTALGVAGIAALSQAAKPTVVTQPAPQIVRPEIITVPAE